MSETSEALEVSREVEIEASPETVWQFLVDPARARTWWGRTVTFDPRPGGVVRVEVTEQSVALGEVVEIDPPRRLVYTWGWEVGGAGPELVPPGSSRVEIDLEPAGRGTTLRLRHSGLPTGDLAASHTQGWDHYLGRLATAAAGGDPGPDPWAAGPQ